MMSMTATKYQIDKVLSTIHAHRLIPPRRVAAALVAIFHIARACAIRVCRINGGNLECSELRSPCARFAVITDRRQRCPLYACDQSFVDLQS